MPPRFLDSEKRKDIKQSGFFPEAIDGARAAYAGSRINFRMQKGKLHRLPNFVMSRRTVFHFLHDLNVVIRALATQQKLSGLTTENQGLRSSLEQNTLVLDDRTSRCVP